MMDWPRVTVVTPSYNQGRFLEEAIRSVLAQDYPNLEYIIMDGGSTDESVDVIRKYSSHLTFWTSERDGGQSAAINRGWRIGTGEIVAWLNADDLYEPGVIREAVHYLATHPEAGMVCGSVQAVAEDDSTRVAGIEVAEYKPLATALTRMVSPGTTAAFIRRDSLEKAGYLNEQLRYWIDPELWIRIALHAEIGHVRRPWYRFRVHSGSKTRAFREGFYVEALQVVTDLYRSDTLPDAVRAVRKRAISMAHLQLAGVLLALGKREEARAHYQLAFSHYRLAAIRACLHRPVARMLGEYAFGRYSSWQRLIRLWHAVKRKRRAGAVQTGSALGQVVANPSIVYIQYTNPALYPPLEHSSRILAGLGWDVLFLGIHVRGPADRLEFPQHPGIAVKKLASCSPGIRQKLHYAAFVLWAAFHALTRRTAWVYVSDPVSAPAGLILRWLLRVSVVYHEHDSPASARPGLLDRIRGFARKVLARSAAVCILPQDGRAELFRRELNVDARSVLVVPNCPRLDETIDDEFKAAASEMTVYYHGNLSPLYIPTTVVRAIAKLPGVRLRVIGYETPTNRGFQDELRRAAKEAGVQDRCEFLEAMPRFELLRECRAADIGLALAPVSSANINNIHLAGASNKAFDYLACGAPLLVSKLPEWIEQFVDRGLGLACDPDDAESIAAALRWYSEHPDQRRQMAIRGLRQIRSSWNYERCFAPALKVLGEYARP